MKNIFGVIGILLMSLAANADYTVPKELSSLIPVGGSEITMRGVTFPDGAKCAVTVSDGAFAFSVILSVEDKNGGLDSRRLAKMQIGLGHHFDSMDVNKNPQRFTSVHEADTMIERDARNSVSVKRSADKITGIQILQEERNFFGKFKTIRKETCILK